MRMTNRRSSSRYRMKAKDGNAKEMKACQEKDWCRSEHYLVAAADGRY